MELKLTIYKDRLCKELDREVTANTFDLSLGVCEDMLDVINIDMFEGGLDALTDSNSISVYMPIVKNALPYIKELLAELFEVTVEELRFVKLSEIVTVVMNIITFALNGLPKKEGTQKN